MSLRERLERFSEPILTMEIRRFERRGLVLTSIVSTLLLLMLPALWTLWRWDQTVARILFLVACGGFLFISIVTVPSYGSRSVSREREIGAWDMLAMTLLKSSEIADQKMLAAAMPMLMIWLAGLPLAILLGYLAQMSLFQFIAGELMLGLVVLALSAWSVQASCECKSGAQAIAYLPASIFICGWVGLIVYAITALVLVIIPDTRSQTGRLALGGFCVLVACLAGSYFNISTACQQFIPNMSGGFLTYTPSYSGTFWTFVFCALPTVALRYLLAWSIENGRRNA